jgi:cation diffusion facilitator CzcD-associated flavoprotein CzcO
MYIQTKPIVIGHNFQNLKSSPMFEQSLQVAVIGAGMAGLLTARELKREGHRVIVFEKSNRLGGTWVYDPRVETDPLGLDQGREIVHSSMYRSLRVNLPSRLMGFLDYPFSQKEGGDPREFPGHEEVLRYLEDFALDFELVEFIRFGHEVVRVEGVSEVSHEWVIESRTRESKSKVEEEVFEAVVVCNGHHTEPRIADFPGIFIYTFICCFNINSSSFY